MTGFNEIYQDIYANSGKRLQKIKTKDMFIYIVISIGILICILMGIKNKNILFVIIRTEY